jgi:nitrate/TMAO reductase-like tetraheme cytochrome c subunit
MIGLAAALILWAPMGRGLAAAQDQKSYVGPETCKECHEEEYRAYRTLSKKAHSFESVRRMRKGLTEEEYKGCLECHTTGYHQPGGFVSETETPGLANAGCESCHGPGSLHSKTQASKDIRGRLTSQDCRGCHNPDRVEAFNFNPLVRGGAH